MNGQVFKEIVNYELDLSFFRHVGRDMTDEERRNWWTSPQGGVEEPYLLVASGTDDEMDAVAKAAREYRP